MGVQGLLPLLDDISERVHISEYKGKRIAVDGYVWLHKGAYSCADDLAKGVETTKYVNHGLHRARMLVYHGITPVIVFDGANLPSKTCTESERDKRRREALAKGKQLCSEGKDALAREHFVKAVDVTPQMAFQLIKALKLDNIEYIVAPYEADAQLAYLEKIGYVDAVLTEDSDLLVFGTKVALYKLDSDGWVTQILREDFGKCVKARMDGWRDDIFRAMCILSGCDYLEGIRGVGVKTAHRLLREFRSVQHVIAHLRRTTDAVPIDYNASFDRADKTFLYQRVYCPIARKLVHLNTPPATVDVEKDWPFVGETQEDEYAQGVACGAIDPVSREAMIDIAPGAFKPTVLVDKSNVAAINKGSLLNFFKPAPVAIKREPVLVKPVIDGATKASPRPKTPQGRPSKFFRSVTSDAAAPGSTGAGASTDTNLDLAEPVCLSPQSSQKFVETVRSEHDAPFELLSPERPLGSPCKVRRDLPAPCSPTLRSPSVRRKRVRSESSVLMCITSPMTAVATPSPRKRVKREQSSVAAAVKAEVPSSDHNVISSPDRMKLKREQGAPSSPSWFAFDDDDNEQGETAPAGTDDTTPEPANEYQPKYAQQRHHDVKPVIAAAPVDSHVMTTVNTATKRTKRRLLDTTDMVWTPNQGRRERNAPRQEAPQEADDVKPNAVSKSIADDWRKRWSFGTTNTASTGQQTPDNKVDDGGKRRRPLMSASVPRALTTGLRKDARVSALTERKPVIPHDDLTKAHDNDDTPVRRSNASTTTAATLTSVSASKEGRGSEVVITNTKLLKFRFTGHDLARYSK